MSYNLQQLVDFLALRYRDTNVDSVLRNKAKNIFQPYIWDVISRYSELYSIDTAFGIWLDYVGYRLGIFERPALPGEEKDADGMVYGRDPYGSKGYNSSPVQPESKALPDDLYRKFLKVRARSLISDCTVGQIEADYKLYFDQITDSVSLADNQNMSLLLTLETLTPYDTIVALLKAGMFYKPAGVRLEINLNPNSSPSMVYGRDPYGALPYTSFLS